MQYIYSVSFTCQYYTAAGKPAKQVHGEGTITADQPIPQLSQFHPAMTAIAADPKRWSWAYGTPITTITTITGFQLLRIEEAEAPHGNVLQ